jgi:hypothetical protein
MLLTGILGLLTLQAAQNTVNSTTFSWPNRAEVHTLNTGITYIFQPNPLWDTATLVAELGSWYIGGYENDDLQFAVIWELSQNMGRA